MNKLQVNPQQKTVGAIVRKVVGANGNTKPIQPFVFDSRIERHPLCDVILPGIDPV